MLRPWTQLSASPHTVHVRWKPFLDHVDHAAPRAQGGGRRRGLGRGRRRAGEDTTVEARAMGVVGGGEASAASQSATGGRSMRHDRRCFGRLEQEDQRFKKHYGRWMDIVRSLELESFILTIEKTLRPRQLGRPTSQPPTMLGSSWRGEYSFFCA